LKVLFVNPPVVRRGERAPRSDRGLESFAIQFKMAHRGTTYRIIDALGVGRDIRTGVRAGSRWPWTQNGVLWTSPHYPFMMGYATSLLREHGHDAGMIDEIGEGGRSYRRFLEKVKKEKADIVVIECSTPTIDIDLWMAEELSAAGEVALAGPHLSQNAEGIAKAHPCITYLLKGEYIQSSLRMADTRKPGIYESEVVEDLDAIPPPCRDGPAALNYFDPSMPTERPQLQVYGSKGCPFKCSYCMWPQTMYGGKVSLRRPEMIAQEIRAAVSKHGYRSIFFDDDTFNIGEGRVGKLCDELSSIGLPWTMMGRLDTSSDATFDKMVECGCVGMRFGVETFDVPTLKRIGKGIERIDFQGTLERLSSTYPELMIHLTMMKDLPGQSDEVHRRDMATLERMGYSTSSPLRNYQLASCVPFPGTALYNDIVRKYGMGFIDDFSRYDGGVDSIMRAVNEKERSR